MFLKTFEVRNRQCSNRTLIHIWSALPSFTVWPAFGELDDVVLDRTTAWQPIRAQKRVWNGDSLLFRPLVDPQTSLHYVAMATILTATTMKYLSVRGELSWELEGCWLKSPHGPTTEVAGGLPVCHLGASQDPLSKCFERVGVGLLRELLFIIFNEGWGGNNCRTEAPHEPQRWWPLSYVQTTSLNLYAHLPYINIYCESNQFPIRSRTWSVALSTFTHIPTSSHREEHDICDGSLDTLSECRWGEDKGKVLKRAVSR